MTANIPLKKCFNKIISAFTIIFVKIVRGTVDRSWVLRPLLKGHPPFPPPTTPKLHCMKRPFFKSNKIPPQRLSTTL